MQKELKPIDRADMLTRLGQDEPFDVVVIGGGATGLGVAVDAASRGLSVAVIDAQDFVAGTSSRSTKLAHGGMRYLSNPAHWSLIREALYERNLLLQNAPKLVKSQPFVVPCFRFWQLPVYGMAMTLYSMFASGARALGGVSLTGRVGALGWLSGIARKGLKGAVRYWDAKFDDARTGIALLQTAVSYGAVAVNYAQVVKVESDGRRIQSVTVQDKESDATITVRGKVFINCAGPWVDSVRRLVDIQCQDLVRISRGTHIMVERSFLPTDNAMVIPQTRDGRVVFCIPWHDMLEIGTTDVEQRQTPFDPEPSADEIDFLISTANQYLTRTVRRDDVKAAFCGLRPLFQARRAGVRKGTANMSRDFAVVPEFGNMLTVAGGKWTTYRAMAESALQTAMQMRLIARRGCMTRSLPLVVDLTHDPVKLQTRVNLAPRVEDVVEQVCEYARYCVRTNAARTAQDVLYRRLRIGQMNAARAAQLLPAVEAAVREALSEGVKPRKRASKKQPTRTKKSS